MEKKTKERFLKQEAESFPESKLETKMKDFPGPDRLKDTPIIPFSADNDLKLVKYYHMIR